MQTEFEVNVCLPLVGLGARAEHDPKVFEHQTRDEEVRVFLDVGKEGRRKESEISWTVS